MDFVKIKDLVKRYGDHIALNIEDISIKEGEMTGLLGPNGAGKSTLISILTGLDDQYSGSVLYRGEEKISKENIGYVPQHLHAGNHVEQHEKSFAGAGTATGIK